MLQELQSKGVQIEQTKGMGEKEEKSIQNQDKFRLFVEEKCIYMDLQNPIDFEENLIYVKGQLNSAYMMKLN